MYINNICLTMWNHYTEMSDYIMFDFFPNSYGQTSTSSAPLSNQTQLSLCLNYGITVF